MTTTAIQIKTSDGWIDSHFYVPAGEGPHPPVIIYMDEAGIRPALFEIAQRLADNGYAVLLPNLYYRSGHATKLQEASAGDSVVAGLDAPSSAGLMEDTQRFIEFFDDQPSIASPQVYCVGYSMGGRVALTAVGTFPERLIAAASFGGARLATDEPDSPHLLAPKITGEVYVGVAGLNPCLAPGETARLEAAFQEAGVNHAIEVYTGYDHGFVMTDRPEYDVNASEIHWANLIALFRRNVPND